MSHSREIRKIIIGRDPLKEGMALLIGKFVDKKETYRISSIIEETNHFLIFGIKQYNVYIATRQGDEVLWKSFEGLPVTIEYGFPGDNDEVIVG